LQASTWHERFRRQPGRYAVFRSLRVIVFVLLDLLENAFRHNLR
jgi:hypothetical protein